LGSKMRMPKHILEARFICPDSHKSWYLKILQNSNILRIAQFTLGILMKAIIVGFLSLVFTPFCFAQDFENYREVLEEYDLALEKCQTINSDRELYDEFELQLSITKDRYNEIPLPDATNSKNLGEINLRMKIASCSEAFTLVEINWLSYFLYGFNEDRLTDARLFRESASRALENAWDEYEELLNDDDSDLNVFGCFINTMSN
jgi:hypothetical protein